MAENNGKNKLIFCIFRRWRGFSMFEARELRDGTSVTLWARGVLGEAKKVETLTFAILAAASDAGRPFRLLYTVPPGVENGSRNLSYPLTRGESTPSRAIIKANKANKKTVP